MRKCKLPRLKVWHWRQSTTGWTAGLCAQCCLVERSRVMGTFKRTTWSQWSMVSRCTAPHRSRLAWFYSDAVLSLAISRTLSWFLVLSLNVGKVSSSWALRCLLIQFTSHYIIANNGLILFRLSYIPFGDAQVHCRNQQIRVQELMRSRASQAAQSRLSPRYLISSSGPSFLLFIITYFHHF